MRSELTEEFENTAARREEKAAVHRADPRNRGARSKSYGIWRLKR